MKNLVLALSCVLIATGCVTHRITLTPEASAYEGASDIRVEQEFERIPHCGAEMLTVITLGVLPSWCGRTFIISSTDPYISPGKAHVTFVQGWISLVLAPLPTWSFDGADVENQIQREIQERE